MAYGGATMDDFLGDGVNDLPDAPAMTEEEVRRKREADAARAEAERLRGVPLASQASVDAGGGTSVYQITDENLGTHIDPDSQTTVQRVGGPAPAGGTTGRGALDTILDDTGRRSDEGATDRKNALQDVIDRFEGAQDSFDTSQQDQSRLVQQQAQRQSGELFSRAMNFDRNAAAARYSDEALSNSLAIARSAPGGAARSSALFNALESLPEAQAEGQRQANSEARSQQNVALQASGQLGQLATQTRSQDEAQSEAYTGIGLDVAKNIANFTGQNLQLDQRDREFLGEVALQVANLDLDWEKLGVDESLRRLELQLAKQGLDQEWKIFKESQKITGKDILGGIFSLGGSVLGGFSAGKAAGR
jgi:hypothetical protein